MSTRTDMEALKEKLLARKRELEQELAEIAASDQGASRQSQDIGDQVLSASMETLKVSLQDNEVAEYKRIIQALKMVQDGTYGICIDCDQPIAERRLLSYPNASRCLRCQEAFEEGQ